MVISQVRYDDGLRQDGSEGFGEKWLYLGYVFKVQCNGYESVLFRFFFQGYCIYVLVIGNIDFEGLELYFLQIYRIILFRIEFFLGVSLQIKFEKCRDIRFLIFLYLLYLIYLVFY